MPTEKGGCPDDASCHFGCVVGCWRVANDEPLTSSGSTKWPASIVEEYTPVSVNPLPVAAPDVAPAAATEPDDATSNAALDVVPLLAQLQDSVDTAKRRRARVPEPAPEPEPEHPNVEQREPGAPIVNLTALVQSLHYTRGDLRARAQTLRASAKQLEGITSILLGVAHHCELAADQVEELRGVLDGER